MPGQQPSIFVSYAHEDAGLAGRFAKALEEAGARVWLDQGELLIGDSLIARISEAIAEFDFVAALVSPASVVSNWCQKEIALAMSKQLKRGSRAVTVLPLRVGDVDMPDSLLDVKWAPLDVNSLTDSAVEVVASAARHLERVAIDPGPGRGQASDRRPGGQQGRSQRSSRGGQEVTQVAPEADQPVRVVGVDTEGIGNPRNDGTRGSALYRVPLQLNRVPPAEWSAAFPAAWDRPPAFTGMHRPGIASVEGDRIVLTGTTIEELERYHLQTLKLVVRQLNAFMDSHREAERQKAAAAMQEAADHARRVRDAVQRLSFDDE